ncbi:MAG: nucleoside triphosphate pyrophosphohydrolase [Pseudohongiellaceae bacterium]
MKPTTPKTTPITSDEFARLPAVEKLVHIMQMLRDPTHGCPWDLKQSIQSLVPFTLEEAYEVAEAVEQNDPVELEDELGDLLFQVIFYSQLMSEAGNFTFDDVANGIVDKLIRRHPHVFPQGDIEQYGQAQAQGQEQGHAQEQVRAQGQGQEQTQDPTQKLTPEQVVVNWEAIKQQEREAKQRKRAASASRATDDATHGTHTNPPNTPGILDDVPAALPALQRALNLQQRAAAVGFDWPNANGVQDKLREEVAEYEQAVAEADSRQQKAELGDLLFTLVNLCRHSGFEPEAVLREANKRFRHRFAAMEKHLSASGKTPADTTPDELNRLWEQAKQE